MPRLLIVDHMMSGGGVERFLHGLVGGMLQLDEADEWEITLLLCKETSGGKQVVWSETAVPNV